MTGVGLGDGVGVGMGDGVCVGVGMGDGVTVGVAAGGAIADGVGVTFPKPGLVRAVMHEIHPESRADVVPRATGNTQMR